MALHVLHGYSDCHRPVQSRHQLGVAHSIGQSERSADCRLGGANRNNVDEVFAFREIDVVSELPENDALQDVFGVGG